MPAPPISLADRARHAAGLINQGQHKAAERLLRDVLKSDPGQFEALLAFGVLCGMRGHDNDAVKHLQRAVRKRPQSDAAQYNLGQALIKLGRNAEAAEALRGAAAAAEQPHIHEKLGDCLRQLGHLDEAVQHYQRAIELAGKQAGGMALSSLVEGKRRICDWNGLDALEDRLVALVQAGEPVEPLLLNYLTDDPSVLRRNAEQYAGRFLPRVNPDFAVGRRFKHHPSARDRLRIGYLCSDFRNHATAHLIAELIEEHDRKGFEIVGLSYGPDDGSAIRRRLEAAFHRFSDLERLSSQEVAKRINGLGIDILVDLNGYIANARPEILAARPAPVQCHYLAFPGTLGSPAIDYMIVDPVVVPAGAEAGFSEALVRLPHCYQPNDAKREIAPHDPTRAACGLPETGVVLASFNNSIKLSPEVFGCWMRVLAACPGCVLWLFADNAWAPAHLREAARSHGIDPERLVFAGYAPSSEHLARLRHVDLLLDCFPYGAHTTASDALWMGVPVLTLAGRSFASRVGSSLLGVVGMSDLATRSLEEYESMAIELASEPQRIALLKQRLAASRKSCRLFDSPLLARHLEAAYRGMWERWQRSERPIGFDIQPV